MAEKSLSMEMGNLVCRFGNSKVLLDLVDEIVLPSFLDEKLVRRYSKTSYFFYDVSTVRLSNNKKEPVIGVVGRFIKDTTLEREQIFEREKGLIKDSGAMKSSPSAMFLLILNNHRLIYVKETKDAPSKETFRSTLLNFLRHKHKKFIDSQFEKELRKKKRNKKRNTNKPVLTKKELNEKYPSPSLQLIPLTSDESIEQFIKKYDVLKRMEISFADRNDENDNDPFFEELQKRKDEIESTKSVVIHSNPKGLDKEQVVTEISEATAQGNQDVTLNGIDNSGDVLRGNNEKFQLRKPLDELSTKPSNAANELFDSFLGLVEDGLVKIPKTSNKAKSIVKKLVQRLF